MKVLVPLDNSEYATKALQRAIDMVKKEGGELTLMSVALDFRDLEEIRMHYSDKLEAQAIRAVDAGRELAEKAGVKPKTRVEVGSSPADNIVKFAEEAGIELIVIGHRGSAALGRFRMGSVASRVVAYAPCSVLVVR